MFCPFIKDDCKKECIFNSNIYYESNLANCNIMSAINIIQSSEFEERTPKDYLESIESILKRIESNTGNDQTESSYILSELEDISNKIDNVMKKI